MKNRINNLIIGCVIASLLIGFAVFELPQSRANAQTATGNVNSSTALAKPKSNYTLFLPAIFLNHPNVESIFGIQTYAGPTLASNLEQEAKVHWVRDEVWWSQVQPTNTLPNSYDFGVYDSMFLDATKSGLHLVITIRGNPSWAAAWEQSPISPTATSQYLDFVSALVKRYSGDLASGAPGSPEIDYWEFYNEPDYGGVYNGQQWLKEHWGNNGKEYAQMLCSVYPLVKAANPQAKVVLGGLAYDYFRDQGGSFNRNFLDDVLANGGGSCFDVMNFHYYPAFAPYWASYGPGLSGKANYLRDIKLAQYGLSNKPMICTETGWMSNPGGYASSPEIQAQYVVKLFSESRASNLDLAIWWLWSDIGYQPYDDFGLLTQGLAPKPSFYVYKTAITKFGNAPFQRALSLAELGNSAMEGYLFQTSQNPLYILWSNDGVTRTVPINLPRVQITDLYGTPSGILTAGANGYVQVPVGANPVYAEIAP